ncbi:DNA-directed RNA polymerase subunit beta [Klosneuvirus KNV1]|uniref:DNA-directed RNA polymerase n=1 Tax=Klosneuvirus KNV1 TaxID=1977640 RepID=A0A1V0SI23_9VIRU|nr:DNA-directed RNA polymerase subunit beta [Klosneuvirus KNV1]
MDIVKEINYMNSKTQDGGKKKGVIKKAPKQVKETTPEFVTPSNNLINITDTYRFIDLYFKQKNIMYSHLYNSFDKLLDEDIPNFLKNNNNTFFEKVTADKIYRYKFKFENIAVKPPFIDIDDEIMLPQHARLRNLTYASKLIATITQIQEITDIATGEVTEKIVGTPENTYPITDIPILVRSKYCSLNIKKGYDKTECAYDPGGYFIVNGSEKVVMSLERMIENRPLVFIKKDASAVNYTVQVNSKSYKSDMMQQVTIRMKKDMNMSIKIQILNEVPVFILLKALGIESDKDIINYCVYDHNDNDMINIVRLSLENAKDVKDKKIITQLDALNYLTTHLKVYKKYNETDKDTKQKEKRIHLTQLLKDSFLIHMPGTFVEKAYYIGFMINRLLQCYLGRIPPDDRDNYINKRVDLPGQLMMDLIKQYYKKMLNECNKFFKRKNSDDEHPLNIINQIKPTIIKQGLTTALLTGAWNKKKGVAQMLQRLTPLQTFSSLRRINSPTVDASTNKLTSPRHLHNSLIGPLCFIETSEGAKVGLVKNLSMIGNVTVMKNSIMDDIKKIVKPKVYNIQDVSSNEFQKYTRVLINGEIIGLTDKPYELYKELKQMKYDGTFDPQTSISLDIRTEFECKDLRISCDTGRIFHPVLRVENNNIQLSKEMIESIGIEEKESATKITSWNQFMMKYPGVIEYIDTDEKSNAMIAMLHTDVEKEKTKMINSIELLKKLKESDFKNIINRYDQFTYVKYTHCEIHPSLLIGLVVANIPFLECNQGPRNIFQYSQARQAMGIYATNWRDRLDISYILYHPQRPIVTTRAMKYINTEKMPAGENCIVAISVYSGYSIDSSQKCNTLVSINLRNIQIAGNF